MPLLLLLLLLLHGPATVTAVSIRELKNRPQAAFDAGTPPATGGINGYDISEAQSMSFRFFNNIAGTLDHLELWFMSNVGGSTSAHIEPPTVDVTLGLGDETVPYVDREDWRALETWKGIRITAAGWEPYKVVLNATAHERPILDHSQFVWVIVESKAPATGVTEPVWSMSDTVAFGSARRGAPGAVNKWEQGGFQQAGALKIVLSNVRRGAE
eukprot:COSAG01_NODE_3136_length_6529_cov_6.221617_5_plen_213_part_00